MTRKEEILLKKLHKVYPIYHKLNDIFAEGELKLILESMEEYAEDYNIKI